MIIDGHYIVLLCLVMVYLLWVANLFVREDRNNKRDERRAIMREQAMERMEAVNFLYPKEGVR